MIAPGGCRRGDGGTVTAELAVVLPGVVLMCAALLLAGQAVISEVRCVDAARSGARMAARGESSDAVVAEARRRAPPDADVQVVRAGPDVRVDVSVPLSPAGLGWAGLTVRGSATARSEQP